MAAELHVHLEGSVDPQLLGLEPPSFTDFAGFIRAFTDVVKQLRSPEDYARITRALLDRFASELIDYAEVTLSAGVVLWKKQDLHKTFEAIRGACNERPEIHVEWCFDAVRQFGPEPAFPVVEIAADFIGDGVISFGIGGDEVRGPAPLFREVYDLARTKGLRLTAHAGETDGPQSIWDALTIGAERVGHGITAVRDPALMRHLRDNDIPLEVCITSNVATGAVASLEEHPVRRLFDEGVPIILGTDDPALFQTTLTREFEIARDRFGFTEQELDQLRANAYKYAFTSAAPRPRSEQYPAASQVRR